MIELVRTEDGSLSCFHDQVGELYHNRAGAYTEALHNYCLPSGAVARLSQRGQLRLLDACFGLGYNTFVLIEQLCASGCRGEVIVKAVENDQAILAAIPQVLGEGRFKTLAAACVDNQPACFGRFKMNPGKLDVTLEIERVDLREFVACLAAQFDLIFHDPFSPRKLPELWTVDIFKQYYRALKPQAGSLLTYSSAGAVRGGLQAAEFALFATEAVGAKRGGTLASADPNYSLANSVSVEALSAAEVKRLEGKSSVPYRDSSFRLSAAAILAARTEEQALR